MIHVALKMLFGDRAKYIAIVTGLTFASLLICQQGAIFAGFMTRTYSYVDDTPQPDVWVMHPETHFSEDAKKLREGELSRVRGVPGVGWAVPVVKAYCETRLPGGAVQVCNVVGLDDATLAGAPAIMAEGRLDDLRLADGVIADEADLATHLAVPLPDGSTRPLRVGDVLEINERRAVVVGISRTLRRFFWQPTLYTTNSRAAAFAPGARRLNAFVLVKSAPGADPADVAARISASTGLKALTSDGFRLMNVDYVARRTGIAVNFGISIALGFLVGLAIAGQNLYAFTVENLRYFGALKAMGASDASLLRMVLVQAVVAAALGYGLGVGIAAIFGRAIEGTELAFHLPAGLLAGTFVAVLAICMGAAALSIRRVVKLEPAIVFKG